MPEKKRRKAQAAKLGGAFAAILAGGAGTRLWPLSRSLLPKQLLSLNGERTLLQQTAQRVLSAFEPERVFIVTNEEHVFEVRNQIRGIDPSLEERVLAEPLACNTLPAILLALSRIVELEPEPVLAVFPSDHLVQGEAAFAAALARGVELAAEGRFVTFGVPPSKPETGYGYIARGEPLGRGAFTVTGFVEKPDAGTAALFVADGRHFWNSGMLLCRTRELLKAVAQHTPRLWDWWLARKAAPLAEGYRNLPAVSVDYGILEKVVNVCVVEAGFALDDLGSWEALYRIGDKDENGNVIQGDVLALDCRGCLLVSHGGKLAAVGLADTLMIQTRDATFSCPLGQVQRVKDVVARLKSEGSALVESHPTVRRPWGSYCVLEEGLRYKIKRIVVNPGARLSSQMHHHRSEHWVVIDGTARVAVGDEERTLVENQSIDIPKVTTHRLENPGKVPLEIIEIQSGPYLGEDDIVRYDDVYGRVK